jgi:hypothetical protein
VVEPTGNINDYGVAAESATPPAASVDSATESSAAPPPIATVTVGTTPIPEASLAEKISAIEESIARLCLEEQQLKARAKSCKAEREELTTELAGLLAQQGSPASAAVTDHDQAATTTVATTGLEIPPEAQAALKKFNDQVGDLRATVEFTFRDDSSIDVGGAKSLDALKLTEKQLESFAELDPPVRTVGDLEKLMNRGDFVPGKMKGFGPTKIDAITDKLLAFRQKFPVPSEPAGEAVPSRPQSSQPEPTSEAGATAVVVASSPATEDSADNSEVDRDAYAAGCEAAITNQPVSLNPYQPGTRWWHSWDRGWQDTSE